MAMATGPNRGIVSDINVTPMIDVLLVLIIVFMVLNTATSATGLDALIPKPPNTQHDSIQPRTVVVQLLDAGADRPVLKINGESATWDTLSVRLIDIYKQRAERVLFVRADSNIDFKDVATVIDTAHGLYADMRIGLMR